MPTALHPQAKFDPIPPDLDLPGLVDRTPNLKWVQRVSRSQIRNLGHQEFEKLVLIHVIIGGKPLVIEGWDAVLPNWLFNADWLEKTYDKKQESIRDITAGSDIPMTTGHYLRSMKQLTNQWTPNNFRDERRQRLYLKDIDCPPEWHDMLQKIIHPNLFYLNENVTETGGVQKQGDDMFGSDPTVAPAGDLMSSLPKEMRAQNLMCYIGHEGTFTPAHREMCASLGQNIMVEASSDANGEKAGSSVWFMTESKDRAVVREYFLSMLGHDIEIEKHFAQINGWKKAPFDVYVAEQKPGDFILIPPLAAHQVWNRGTRTIKVAWNRTTAETLYLAFREALPKARLVCRDEQYKNKAMVYFTLEKYFKQLEDLEENAEMTQMSFAGFGQDLVKNSPRAKQLAGDFKKLFWLFTDILVDEMFAHKEKEVEFLEFDSCVTCSYCRSNIFNRFLTCKHCVRTLINGDEDAYDICMECYAMGRSCACLSGLKWCEQWSWPVLVDNYEDWRAMVIKNDGYVDLENSPQPFEVARHRSGKKSVAQICQEALRRRPWRDITKPDREKTPSDSEQEVDGEKPKKKYKRKQKKGELRRCHVCCHKDYSYRVHECTNPGCSEAYCYGVLYRAFDMMPQKVLENEKWQCPKCLGICNCGHCRRAGNTDPYTPKNTSLGHDTRPIADDRSVEALVDFRVHNLSWLKAAGEESRSKDSRRMKRLREQADSAKAQGLTEQVEAERTMQNESQAASGSDSAMDASTMDSYGQQTQDLGGETSAHQETCDQPVADADIYLDAQMIQAEPGAGPDGTATGEDENDASLYPDPSVMHRIGMGYYEQDDTPDKILFDPYQAPSADMMMPESELPDGVKKSIRAAKRKARRENEDPDYVASKSHQKKPRLVPEPDFLNSMDPALFDEAPVAQSAPAVSEAVMDTPTQPAAEQPVGETPEMAPSEAESAAQKKGALWFDANEPELRHAKPLTSYVETDEMDLDEVEEVVSVPITSQASRKHTPPGDSQNAIDMAADAVRAIFSKPAANAVESAESGVTSSMAKIPKKRGRPPKNAFLSGPSGQAVTDPAPIVSSDTWRPRGRPRKSAATEVKVPAVEDQAEDSDPDELNDQLEAQLASELAMQESLEQDTQISRRGRPRRSVATAAPVEATATDDSDGSEFTAPKPITVVKRGRGRPRRSEVAQAMPPAAKVAPRDSQFMSMAERMALRGKKFKMAKSRGTPTRRGARSGVGISSGRGTPSGQETPSSRLSGQGMSRSGGKAASAEGEASPSLQGSEEPVDDHEGSTGDNIVVNNSRSASPISQRGQSTASPQRGPTIVRLSDGDSDVDELGSVSSSSVGSGDDGDIPARAPISTSRGGTRGRGRGRGRGGGRGRGRGGR